LRHNAINYVLCPLTSRRPSQQDTRGVIFVSDDQKEDWWRKGPRIDQLYGPRAEHIDEFKAKAQAPFWMYPSDQFLNEARTRLNLEISDVPVKAARDVRTFLELMKTRAAEHAEDSGSAANEATVSVPFYIKILKSLATPKPELRNPWRDTRNQLPRQGSWRVETEDTVNINSSDRKRGGGWPPGEW
jgi:hypothetical protein